MAERTLIPKFNPQDHKRQSYYFNINDHTDLLVEILRRLDGRSLCAAATVCRLWHTLASADSIWEHLCFRHVTTPPPSASPSVRHVVSVLGGYRRLYMLCIRPVLSRLHRPHRRSRHSSSSSAIPPAGHLQVQLSLSLFCIDYYERLCLDAAPSPSASSSLMFLRKPLKRSLIAN